MTKTHDLIWDSLYMADVRARYFARLAGRLRKTERLLAVVVAVGSSGSVVSLFAGQDLAAKILGVLTAVIAGVLAAYKFDKRANVAASHSRQWLEISSEYEVLWTRIEDLDDAEAIARHRELEKKHFQADELAIAEFQLDDKLLDTCFSEVATSRGLQVAA